MGMLAGYYAVSETDYQQLLQSAQAGDMDLEYFYDLTEDGLSDDAILDIDKMWDVAHFILTGQGVTAYFQDMVPEAGNHHASEGSRVVLGSSLWLEETVIGTSSPEEVKALAAYLEVLNPEKLVEERFSMEACQEADLYPSIWDYDEESDEIKDDILSTLNNLREFYCQAAHENRAVIVEIS